MNEEKSHSFRGPLMELVIIIGVFAIVSVYILRMFMTADRLQGTAVNTSKGTIRAESAAEVIKCAEGSTEEELTTYITNQLGLSTWENNSGKMYVKGYTGDWKETDDQAEYYMVVTLSYDRNTEHGIMINGIVTILKPLKSQKNEILLTEGKTYCSLNVKHFVSE